MPGVPERAQLHRVAGGQPRPSGSRPAMPRICRICRAWAIRSAGQYRPTVMGPTLYRLHVFSCWPSSLPDATGKTPTTSHRHWTGPVRSNARGEIDLGHGRPVLCQYTRRRFSDACRPAIHTNSNPVPERALAGDGAGRVLRCECGVRQRPHGLAGKPDGGRFPWTGAPSRRGWSMRRPGWLPGNRSGPLPSGTLADPTDASGSRNW